MPEDPASEIEQDRINALRARAEDLAPFLRSVPGPGFGTVLALILVQLVFTLAAPDEDWANFVSIVLQASILWAGMVAAKIPRVPFRIGTSLIVAIIIVSGILLFNPATDIGPAVPVLITVGLVFVTPVVIVRGVRRSMRVEGTITLHVMYGVLSIYLLIGYAFALIFNALGELSSASFFANDAAETGANFLYFAFVTMTTVGYGDLAAADGLGRAFAIALALVGQIYLVTVVALIVSNLGTRADEA